jgi:hypothetical protein
MRIPRTAHATARYHKISVCRQTAQTEVEGSKMFKVQRSKTLRAERMCLTLLKDVGVDDPANRKR